MLSLSPSLAITVGGAVAQDVTPVRCIVEMHWASANKTKSGRHGLSVIIAVVKVEKIGWR